jgi:hypothetical protein
MGVACSVYNSPKFKFIHSCNLTEKLHITTYYPTSTERDCTSVQCTFNWNASVTGNTKEDGRLSPKQTRAKVNCKLLSRYQHFTFIPQCGELLAPTATSSDTGDYVLSELYKAGMRSHQPDKSKVMKPLRLFCKISGIYLLLLYIFSANRSLYCCAIFPCHLLGSVCNRYVSCVCTVFSRAIPVVYSFI